MRAALIPLFLSLASGVTEANPPYCLAGDPEDLSLHRVFSDNANPENEPIRLWRDSPARAKIQNLPPFDPSCPKPQLKKIGELAQNIKRKWTTLAAINPNCVAAAMATVDTGVMKVQTVHNRAAPGCKAQGKVALCPTRAYSCASTSSQPRGRPGSAPCVTPEMAEYVTWLLNQAIGCFSPSEDPIDARTLFRKLNNESQFGFFIANKNGIGLNQLVPIAVREMLAPDRGYGAVIEPLRAVIMGTDRKDPIRTRACQPFRSVIENTPPRSISERYSPGHCELLQPGIGVARSVLLGVGNFVHVAFTYKHGDTDVSANGAVTRLGFDPKKDSKARELRDHLALAYYSAAGIRGGLAVFEATASELGCLSRKRRGTCTSNMFVNRFRANMRRYYLKQRLPNYFDEIDERFRGLMRLMDGMDSGQGPLREYSTSDLRGDRCLL